MVAKVLGHDPAKLAALGDDLASTGYFALIRAAELFDENKGAKFSSYACFAIERRLRLAVKLNRPIRPPHHLKGDELAEAMKRSYVGPLPYRPHGDRESHDPPAPPGPEPFAEEEQKQRQQQIEWFLAKLGPRHRTVIVRRFWEGRKLHEVAAEFGVTREWVRQIEARALEELRELMSAQREPMRTSL
jgi:RNA polymerase primary sigma factor/RNA polymerase sigma factor